MRVCRDASNASDELFKRNPRNLKIWLLVFQFPGLVEIWGEVWKDRAIRILMRVARNLSNARVEFIRVKRVKFKNLFARALICRSD